MIESKTKSFSDIQQEYDHHFKTDVIRDEDRAYTWHARQLLKQKPDAGRVLDIACGGGFFLRELRKERSACALTGLDISSEAISIAKRECAEASYVLAVGESLPFAAALFDAVACLGSLEHFLDLDNAITEMKRVAAPGAVFYILVPNIFFYKDIFSVLFTGTRVTRNQTHERFASWGEWKSTLEDLGLDVFRTVKYNGIARSPFKQFVKDLVIPLRFSYHFLFLCRVKQTASGKPAHG